MWTKLLCLALCAGFALAQTESKLVELPEQGPVRGYKDAQGDIFSFLGVPYATAPTGAQKFNAPLPPPVWTEPFEAVNRWIACPQFMPLIPTQEDCLVATILVPDVNTTSLPVLVVIHGGAYVLGTGYMDQFDELARTKKAIVVTFNYRLGVQGFLCLGTEDVPGNGAMKDQVALLRWVNKNIASFGGNPDDVTICGCSAGGSSVAFLSISPMAAGLFKRAITESGSVFGVAGTQIDPIKSARKYAIELNFTNVDDLNALEEFYKSASHELLLSKMPYSLDEYGSTTIPFAPCVERDVGQEIFLADAPVNILKNGSYPKIPYLNGFAEMEGLVGISAFNSYKDKMNDNFSDFLPDDLQFENEAQKNEVAAKVKDFYFGNKNVTDETILIYIDYMTDVLFAYGMLRAANILRESLDNTIYLYEYSFVDENSPIIPNTDVRGADHCYQYQAVVDQNVTNASEEYKVMKETMRELWLNFITTGNPTPADSSLPPWPAMSGFAAPFMSINVTSRLEQAPLLGDRVRFWDSIYEQHYREPVPPSSASTFTMSFAGLIAILVVNNIV